MKRLMTFVLVMLAGLTASAKTTYIPTYASYIHIVYGSDTISVCNNIEYLELSDSGGMFNIVIEHEVITNEKVKSIKRAKRAAGWAAFAAVVGGVSANLKNSSRYYRVTPRNEHFWNYYAEFYDYNAKKEQALGIKMYIENTSGAELMINDMERGLTWYLPPKSVLDVSSANPNSSNLRISDIKNTKVRYTSILAGSFATKYDICYEDDECWITDIYTREHYQTVLVGYKYISKSTYEVKEMVASEYEEFIESKKKKD